MPEKVTADAASCARYGTLARIYNGSMEAFFIIMILIAVLAVPVLAIWCCIYAARLWRVTGQMNRDNR